MTTPAFDAAVGEAIKTAEATAIAPRFRKLTAGDVEEKAPGELVTVADQHCEQLLTTSLQALRPIPVVGEEATASDGDLLHLVNSEPAVWLVDPLDGTKKFAAGSPDFAVMVALVENAETVASWIWRPQANTMATATRGGGAQVNGRPVAAGHISSPLATATGVVLDRFFTAELKTRVDALFPPSLRLPERCAGVEYPELPSGGADFLLYWRTLPWDHAPGALFATEAGFVTIRPDGAPYRPGQQQGGLLVSHPALATDLASAVWGTTPALIVRAATPTDIPAIVACVAAAYQPYVERMGKPPAPMLDEYAELVGRGVVQVALVDGVLAGLVVGWPEPDHFYIDNVAVHPAQQGAGIGSHLLTDAARQARRHDRTELRLYTNETMTENLTYYPRRGFTETHRGHADGYARVYFSKPV